MMVWHLNLYKLKLLKPYKVKCGVVRSVSLHLVYYERSAMCIWVGALEIMRSYFLVSYQIVQISSSCKNMEAALSRGTFSHTSWVDTQTTLNTGAPVTTNPLPLPPVNSHAIMCQQKNAEQCTNITNTSHFSTQCIYINRTINPTKNPQKGEKYLCTLRGKKQLFSILACYFIHLFDSNSHTLLWKKNKT